MILNNNTIMSGFNHLKFNSLVQEFIRNNKKESLSSVARNSSVNRQALTSYCDGTMVPGAEAIYKISVYIKCDIREFFDWDKMTYPDKSDALVLNQHQEEYNNNSEAWHAAYEAQKQLTECKNELLEKTQELYEVRIELEQTKKEYAIIQDAKAG